MPSDVAWVGSETPLDSGIEGATGADGGDVTGSASEDIGTR